MTSEKKLFFDTSDVRSIVCECKKCRGRFGIPSGRVVQLSDLISCPYCKAEWCGPDYETLAREYVSLMVALDDVNRAHSTRSLGFAFRLEFDDPC